MLIPWVIGQFFESSGPQSLALVLAADMFLALAVLLALSRQIARPREAPLPGEA
jgi:hypothetical protein